MKKYFLVLLTACSTYHPGALAQKVMPAMGNRTASHIASTPDFNFHSDFWVNLHTYLYGIAGGGPGERTGFDNEGEACFESLEGDVAAGWQQAETFYLEQMGERHHRSDPLMRFVRYSLTNLAVEYSNEPLSDTLMSMLRNAAPAYQECLWEMHDTRNRTWIAEITSLLVVHGPSLQAKLAQHYREPWPDPLTIDVVSYSDFAGANTASGPAIPPHTMMSSTQPNMAGMKGLEMVLHEASHTMFGFSWGTVTEALLAASEALEVRPPRDLWHALSFYTSGELVTEAAKESRLSDFQPYAKRTGMFEGVYEGYLEPIETHWRPYLNGEVDLTAALTDVIAAIYAQDG